MSRSPWREALDGQIRVLRELRKPIASVHLGQNADVPEIRSELPDEQRYVKFAYTFGETLAQGIETCVREAEPIYMAPDIAEAMYRQLDVMVTQVKADKPDPFSLDTTPLAEEMLPILCGVLTLPGYGFLLEDVPSDEGQVRHSDRGQVYIKAIYFGYEVQMEARKNRSGYSLECRTRERDARRKGMGVTIFIDSVRSGYHQLTREFGEHLVPVPLGNWEYGTTINDWLAWEAGKAKASKVNASGTQVLIAATGAYLLLLFRMMQQRITRWGGVGLNRTESREAEREKLQPRVQLVTWRKANYVYPEGHIPVAKNWSCRWSVRPHIRRYKSGKVVHIQSYIKGPPEKELRLPIDRAHQVIR